MEFGKRSGDLWHAMAALREELRVLAEDKEVARGDLNQLVRTVQQIDRDIAEAAADASQATAMELEDLVRIRRYGRTLAAEVDRYLRYRALIKQKTRLRGPGQGDAWRRTDLGALDHTMSDRR